MAPDKKTIWDKITSNSAILIFALTVVFNAGKYTGTSDNEVKEIRQEFKDYKEQQQFQRTQDNLFMVEVRNAINNQNIQIAKLIESQNKKSR